MKQNPIKGLGMFVVKRLMEIQNGNVFVNSKVGEGTRFDSYLIEFQKGVRSMLDRIKAIEYQDNNNDNKYKKSLFVLLPILTKYLLITLLMASNMLFCCFYKKSFAGLWGLLYFSMHYRKGTKS